MRRAGGALVGVLLAAAALVFGTAGTADAHAQLVSSTPGQGAVVEVAPSTLRLEFNERVEARSDGTRIFTGDGTELPASVRSSDRSAVITPGADLPQGTVVVSWSVVSADGHTINGSITFAIGEPTPGNSANEAFEEPVTTGIGAGRWGATALVIVGVVVLVAGVVTRRERVLGVGFGVAMTALVVAGLLASLDRNGRGWDGVLDWSEWVDGWLSWRGLVVCVGVLAGAYAVSSARARRLLPAWVGAVVLVATVPGAWLAPGTTPPAVALAAGEPVAQVEVAGHVVRVEFTSVVVGTTEATVTLLADGRVVRPFAPPRLSMASDGGDPIDLGDVPLTETAEGGYRGTVTVPQPGGWTVAASVRLDEFTNPVVELPFRFGQSGVSAGTVQH